ncbi:sigma-70 region 4 domain-containing protein [Patulibacter americanus]|uniref:sigma-70 region 4 domain-containing protein n=1 Tax=Patulibacter americanus TaxID=588672 RepID=UPI0003B67533|nr:sigma-70 region 4 domain-containing protein [Patulibacter americanus]
MSSEHGSTPSAGPAVAASRFDRNGETVFNLALRITGSPGASWHAAVAAFTAVTERIPADAAPGTDDRDLLLMGCWHARGLLSQLAANPEYAAQLRAHDEASGATAPLQAAVVAGNDALPVDQREVLALRGLSDLDHAELSALLRVDPGLLASMLAQSRLMLRDAMRGGALAQDAMADPEDRHALALAALRQDGQLRGPEGRERLATWIEASPAHAEAVDALEEAGLSYGAWTPSPPPEGLRDAVIAAAAAVTPASGLGGAAAPGAAAAAAASAGADAAPQSALAATGSSAPEGAATAADPHATVEWSSSDVAALGLEGASPGRRPAEPLPDDDDVADDGEPEPWDDGWDGGEPSGELLQPLDRSGRAPRWQIAVVVILLVAVIVALVVALTKGDEPTKEAPTPGTSTRERTSTRDTGAAPTDRVLGSVTVQHQTFRIVRG